MALPLALVVVIGLGWSAFWLYASSRAASEIDGWRAREAKAGRIHTCGDQAIGGYPFRIEVRCRSVGLEFRTFDPPLALNAKDGLAVVQVYDPTLLIAELSGPLSVGEPGKPPTLSANWKLAEASIRGTPQAPERVSIVMDDPTVARFNRGAMEPVAAATHAELHGRIVGGSVADNPVVELVLRLAGASAPELHPLVGQPTDGEIDAVLTGLKDFTPKPWSERMREIAAAGGHIEVKQARFAQGDILAAGAGTLGLTADGRLDGELNITVAGLDKLVSLLGVDQLVQQYLAKQGNGLDMDKVAGSLDRLLPGLGGVVRNNSGGLAAAGIALLGKPNDIEGRKGVSLPLRFSRGAAFLGPVPIGDVPPVF